ncbi:MAG TPA: hypothetical protein VLV86_02390 [Vicinamibacterales bacterium]|nr:hypothetical protein [Vicinamibacterales bacterium]
MPSVLRCVKNEFDLQTTQPIDVTENEKQKAQEIAFYQHIVGAWIQTRMERDKSLLSLATAGLGLLVTLIVTVGPTSISQFVIAGLAAASFLTCIVVALVVFTRNSDHLEHVAKTGSRDPDRLLERLDRVMMGAFLFGVLLTAAAAGITGYAKLQKENNVSNETKIVTPDEQRSLSRIGRLGPQQGGGQGSNTGGSTGSTSTNSSDAGTGGASQKNDK